MKMDLAGLWTFEIDPEDCGVSERWYEGRLAQLIELPGSLQAQGYGEDVSVDTAWTGDIIDRSWFTERTLQALPPRRARQGAFLAAAAEALPGRSLVSA